MLKKSVIRSKTKLIAKTPIKKSSGNSKKPKQKTITWWKKEADKYWSLATRLRFATLKNGDYWAECITCGAERPVKVLQCGHFMSRQYNSTRYLEQNTAPQCYGCNVMQQGKQFEFALALNKLYGDETAVEMLLLAKTPKQFTREELQEIIEQAKSEVHFYEEQARRA